MKRGLITWTLATIMLVALAGLAAAHGPGMDGDMPSAGPGMGMNDGTTPSAADATNQADNPGGSINDHMDDQTGNVTNQAGTPGGYMDDHMDDAGPGPHMNDQDHYYCEETGHYLSYGFKNFWQRNGGVAIFGYPMTEEMGEHGYTVQYLERQRFEYHPELAGTPYEVELGRLGYEQAQHMGLMGMAAFAPLRDNTASNTNSTYFPQTGHSVSNGFRDYWMSHGLDLGDPGISMRESLALFGYPISQEFVDPATGMTVQYFERAVFEYHPDNQAPYQVLLRRLGVNMLANQ